MRPNTNTESSTAASPTPSSMLDPTAAGAYLGGNKPINALTLADWRCKGTGPAYIKVGRLVRYRLADLDAWMNGRVELGV